MGTFMTTWIIAYNKDGNTATLKIDSAHQPDIDEAVALVSRKAEELYPDQEIEHEHEPALDDTPATRLPERYGLTIMGISLASPALGVSAAGPLHPQSHTSTTLLRLPPT